MPSVNIKSRFICALMLVFLGCPGAGARPALPHSGSPIKIAVNNWSSQIILSRITGRLFEKMGYKVMYIPQDTYEQWGSLYRGAVHVQVEVWEGTNADLFDRMMRAGGVVDGGTHDAVTREDWWYPRYVEQLCPGLPDWRALKRCASLFATPETFPYGQYLSGPWEKPDRARIRALEMDFRVIEVENGDVLNKKLFEAINKKQPIVLFNWSPNWVENKFDGEFVEFPAYRVACESDPGWGVNPDLLYDCGNPKTGWLKKAAWSGMPEKWPCAFDTLKKINFDNRTISELVYRVDVEKKQVKQVAAIWIKKNKMLWKSWVSPACLKPGTLEK